MCGVAGFLSNDGLSDDARVMEKMLSAIGHRGPDGEGTLAFEGGWLGHVRLAIRDLTQLGAQPMVSPDNRYSLSYNGEIYNTEELQGHLHQVYGWVPVGGSDTEVLLELLIREGVERTLHMISGMFAFAFIDHETQRLYLARDHIGIKPLFYATRGSRLIAFCSEFKGLLFSEFTAAQVSKQAVACLLERNYIPSPLTLYEDVFKLEPGHYLSCDLSKLGAFSKVKYYQAKRSAHTVSVEDVDEALRASVQRHLISDVDIGCFLSGGVDSSLVAAYASQIKSSPLKTFTIAFEDDGYDESDVASRIANVLKTDHTTFVLSESEMLDRVIGLLGAMDEPFADSSFLATSVVAELASKEVKVCLSGDGGDEAFFGYDKYRYYPKYLELARRLKFFSALVPDRLLKSDAISCVLPFKNSADKLLKFGMMLRSASQKERAIIMDSFWHQAPFLQRVDPFNYPLIDETISDALAMMSELDVKYYLPDDLLVKSDIATMRSSLELRVPLLDKAIFELGLSADFRLHLDKGEGKLMLRELQRRIFPSEVTSAPKMGFRVPLEQWIRGGLKDFCRNCIDICLERCDFLCKDSVDKCWQQHLSNERDNAYWLWSIITLGCWFASNEVRSASV